MALVGIGAVSATVIVIGIGGVGATVGVDVIDCVDVDVIDCVDENADVRVWPPRPRCRLRLRSSSLRSERRRVSDR